MHVIRATVAAFVVATGAIALQVAAPETAHADATPSAQTILDKAIDSDPWGLGGVEVTARAIVTEKGGRQRQIAFDGKSRRYDGNRSKALIAFKAPADLNGMRFLQVQNKSGDDDRYLYMPELKRVRRIAAATRSESFMGTDYSYADMDRRELRDGKPTYKGEETVGKFPCYRIVVAVQDQSIYSSFDVWVRKDNMVALKMVMHDKSGAAVKTLLTRELQKHKDRWHVTRSVMTDHTKQRSTEIIIEKLEPKEVSMDEFTTRNLEKGR